MLISGLMGHMLMASWLGASIPTGSHVIRWRGVGTLVKVSGTYRPSAIKKIHTILRCAAVRAQLSACTHASARDDTGWGPFSNERCLFGCAVARVHQVFLLFFHTFPCQSGRKRTGRLPSQAKGGRRSLKRLVAFLAASSKCVIGIQAISLCIVHQLTIRLRLSIWPLCIRPYAEQSYHQIIVI